MDQTLWTILPNLSIGVISVLALVYVTLQFLKHLDEREKQIRSVEAEVRTTILGQLGQNNQLMTENAKALERVITHLNRL